MAPLTINSTILLNTGFEMPILGFGVYQMSENECEAAVAHALKVGYRHIDSATCYYNEAACARAIVSSGLPRSSIFFTSKVYSNNLSYNDTWAQINSTLRETGFEYIDLMLIHAPFGGPQGRKDAWRALVEAQSSGLIRSLGISNYGIPHLQELASHISELEASLGSGKGGVISVGQWEIHPWLGREDIVSWCREHQVAVQAYSPLTRGKKLEDPLLGPIMRRTGKTPAQVLLRWSLQMGFCPLPKSGKGSRIEENRDVFGFELSVEEMGALSTRKYEPCAWDPTVVLLWQ